MPTCWGHMPGVRLWWLPSMVWKPSLQSTVSSGSIHEYQSTDHYWGESCFIICPFHTVFIKCESSVLECIWHKWIYNLYATQGRFGMLVYLTTSNRKYVNQYVYCWWGDMFLKRNIRFIIISTYYTKYLYIGRLLINYWKDMGRINGRKLKGWTHSKESIQCANKMHVLH